MLLEILKVDALLGYEKLCHVLEAVRTRRNLYVEENLSSNYKTK